MRDIHDDPLDRPFTARGAAALGLTARMLRGPRVRAVLPGVYVGAGTPDSLLLRCQAVQLLLPPGAAISHQTAAAVRSLPLPLGATDPGLHVSVPEGRTRLRVPGVVGHEAQWLGQDIVRRGGLSLTSTARTWCDLAAAGWRRGDLVGYADAVLRRSGPAGERALAARVEACSARRGVRVLREALSLCTYRVDSPMETRLRLVLHDAGLPPPVVNEPVRDGFGEVIHTPDLSWPGYCYALDYDGAHHLRYDDEETVLAGRRSNWRRRHDINRQEQLREAGWTLTVVTAYDVLHQPAALVSRVRTQLHAYGAPC